MILYHGLVSGMESGREKFRRTDHPARYPVSVSQDSVPSNLRFTNVDDAANGAESLNPEDRIEGEFPYRFHEKISTQPINVSGIMNDIAQRS